MAWAKPFFLCGKRNKYYVHNPIPNQHHHFVCAWIKSKLFKKNSVGKTKHNFSKKLLKGFPCDSAFSCVYWQFDLWTGRLDGSWLGKDLLKPSIRSWPGDFLLWPSSNSSLIFYNPRKKIPIWPLIKECNWEDPEFQTQIWLSSN